MNLKRSALLLLLIVGACEADVVRRGGGKRPEGLSPVPDLPLIEDSDDRDPTGAGGDAQASGGFPAGTGGLFGAGGNTSASGGAAAASGGAPGDGDGDGDQMGGAAGASFGGMGGDPPSWETAPRL